MAVRRQTYKVEATVAGDGVDADAVTIDIEGAKDALVTFRLIHGYCGSEVVPEPSVYA